MVRVRRIVESQIVFPIEQIAFSVFKDHLSLIEAVDIDPPGFSGSAFAQEHFARADSQKSEEPCALPLLSKSNRHFQFLERCSNHSAGLTSPALASPFRAVRNFSQRPSRCHPARMRVRPPLFATCLVARRIDFRDFI